jgi:hypothetical protein
VPELGKPKRNDEAMNTGFSIDPQRVKKVEDELDKAGEAVNDVRNTVAPDPVDAGASTAILDTVVSHLFAGAGDVLDHLAASLSAMGDCRTAYLRSDDTIAQTLQCLMPDTPSSPAHDRFDTED